MPIDNIMPVNEGDPKQVNDDIIEKLNGIIAEFGSYSKESGIALLAHPIGTQYVQHASVASNDVSVACPSSEAPAVLFGGTWTKLWSIEATYFRTEGDPDVSEGQDVHRTNGSEPDRMQGFAIIFHYRNSAGSGGSPHGLPESLTQYTEDRLPTTDGTHGTPRTGYTTQVKNRIMIIWKRTA